VRRRLTGALQGADGIWTVPRRWVGSLKHKINSIRGELAVDHPAPKKIPFETTLVLRADPPPRRFDRLPRPEGEYSAARLRRLALLVF
jgi:hypothetical protein